MFFNMARQVQTDKFARFYNRLSTDHSPIRFDRRTKTTDQWVLPGAGVFQPVKIDSEKVRAFSDFE